MQILIKHIYVINLFQTIVLLSKNKNYLKKIFIKKLYFQKKSIKKYTYFIIIRKYFGYFSCTIETMMCN